MLKINTSTKAQSTENATPSIGKVIVNVRVFTHHFEWEQKKMIVGIMMKNVQAEMLNTLIKDGCDPDVDISAAEFQNVVRNQNATTTFH